MKALVSAIAVTASLSGQTVLAQNKTVRPDTVFYKKKANPSPTQREALDRVVLDYGIRVKKRTVNNKLNQGHMLRGTSEEAAVVALMQTGAVEFAETDALVLPDFAPNDPFSGYQWHHPMIGSPEAWDVTVGKRSVVAASCDTGVEASHPDLKKALLRAYNAEDGASTNLTPVNGHGTMTAGAMSAATNNKIGVSGVAGRVRILPIKISNLPNGGAYISTMAHCIEYAADHGASVVNLSYGVAWSPTIDAAAQYLRSKGGLLVVAAGNDGADLSADSDFASVIVVGATEFSNTRAYWSNYGLPIDIVAPGEAIFTTTIGVDTALRAGPRWPRRSCRVPWH
jgi:thermitase